MKPKQITDDIEKLLEVLPPSVQIALSSPPSKEDLLEVVLDLGRLPEARYQNRTVTIGNEHLSSQDLQNVINKLGSFGEDNRAGIERTLHRISAIRNRKKAVIGLTCRVGRAVFGTVEIVRDLIESEQSLLLMGRPGIGKTTVLREIARVMADEIQKRVVIIDTSNEIAGDGDIPHPAIGRARRMQVAKPENQHEVMIEAVENHMPEVIVIDEIGTELETQAARTIAERGVQLIATAHGNSIANLIKNPTLSDLIGGIQSVTLGDDEAKRRRTQKTVLERAAEPTFPIAVEINSRNSWSIHKNIATTVDLLLRGQYPSTEVRSLSNNGQVKLLNNHNHINGPIKITSKKLQSNIVNPCSLSTQDNSKEKQKINESNLNDLPEKYKDHNPFLKVLNCGVSTQILEEIIRHHNWQVNRVETVTEANVILTVKNGLSQNQNIRREAQKSKTPILVIKSNTLHQVERALKRLIKRHESNSPQDQYSHSHKDDEVAALEECRLALEKVVLPLGKPVELLPRNMKVLHMQADLVERYRLRCDIFGSVNQQRLRVYPP